jgi:GntR family transcriptional repressor for pyruvate dehydrogenase complex
MLTNTIALKIIQHIVDSNLAVGTKLPSIRELAELWGCSSSQVRTGLITISALGIIDMHPRAGCFVKQLSPGDLDTLFVLFFRLGMLGKKEDILNLYAVKALLDRETFLNAIKYRTENDLWELEENLNRQSSLFKDNRSFIDADEQFHIQLARISRNSLLVFLLEAIQGMLRPYRNENFTPSICRESWESHLEVFKAIKEQNVADAEKIAGFHTQAGVQRIRQKRENTDNRIF